MSKNKLPDKPSELIRLALKDLSKCERSKRYEVDMEKWHSPEAGRCLVCLAGAVMANTLRVSPEVKTTPSRLCISGSGNNKLLALDYFRKGHILCGLESIGIDYRALPAAVVVTQYWIDPKAFKRDMRRMATMLEQAGL